MQWYAKPFQLQQDNSSKLKSYTLGFRIQSSSLACMPLIVKVLRLYPSFKTGYQVYIGRLFIGPLVSPQAVWLANFVV